MQEKYKEKCEEAANFRTQCDTLIENLNDIQSYQLEVKYFLRQDE